MNRWTNDGLIGFLDTLGHKLHVPRRLLRPICDRYDARLLGIGVSEMREQDLALAEEAMAARFECLPPP